MKNINYPEVTIDFIRRFNNYWKNIPIIDRWLLGELLPPLFFAIGAFTVVSLSVGVMFDLVRKIVESGLSPQIALEVLILRLPSFLVISFPMAMLMATLLAYGRLSSNSELKALRSLGISTRRIIAPALVLSLLMTGITFVFNDSIVPRANRNAELILNRSIGKAIATEIGEDIIYSRKGTIKDFQDDKLREGLTHLFYAWKFSNDRMQEITMVDFSRYGYTQLVLAEQAFWNDNQGKWDFRNGRIITISPDGTSSNAAFKRYLYPLGQGPLRIAELPKDANDMTVLQALKAEALYKNSGNIKEARRMQVRIQEKFTLPMACIVFGLIGSSLGAKPNNRTSSSQGFGLSVVLILFYYVLSFTFSSLGVKGTLSPFLAAWIPVFISIFGGSVLLSQSSK
tara:strand:+ start:112 stop:1305 length:1194 start_codon:yes stop_codon:yes gene_type:complete